MAAAAHSHVNRSVSFLEPCGQEELTEPADADASQAPSTDHMFSTTVSIKGLLKFLSSHQVGGTGIACKLRSRRFERLSQADKPGICQRHCFIAYVYIGRLVVSVTCRLQLIDRGYQ